MIPRIPTFLAAIVIASAVTGCSSLTRPDEIQIYAEPPPAPKVVQAAPQPAAAPAGAQPAAPPGGGG